MLKVKIPMAARLLRVEGDVVAGKNQDLEFATPFTISPEGGFLKDAKLAGLNTSIRATTNGELISTNTMDAVIFAADCKLGAAQIAHVPKMNGFELYQAYATTITHPSFLGLNNAPIDAARNASVIAVLK